MSTRESALRAMTLEEPDRVPMFELYIAPAVAEALLGRPVLYNNALRLMEMRIEGVESQKITDSIVMDVVDLFHKCLRHEIVIANWVNAHPLQIPQAWENWRKISRMEVKKLGDEHWQVGDQRCRYIAEGSRLMIDPQISSTPEEVDAYVREHWGEIDGIGEEDFALTGRIMNELKDKVLVGVGIGYLGSFHEWEISHLPNWLYSSPDTVREFIDFCKRCCIAVANVKLDMGADFCVMDCDWGYNKGPFMSPKHFREYWYPALEEIARVVHSKGSILICHSDGNINMILEDMVRAGIDGIQAIEPTANMDIREIKDKYGDRLVLCGNIDLSWPLTFGTPEDTAEAVRECIKAASSGGGHVMTSCNSIHNKVKPENYVAMCEATRRFGVYPK